MPPSVSVVVPVFNGADRCAGALDSAAAALARARAARGVAAELVAVDDGSTDGTSGVLEGWTPPAGIAYRVVALPENRGPGAARNAGVAASRGEILCFLDHDDRYEPAHVALCLWGLERLPQVAYVRTGVILAIEPHPDRRRQLESTIPINMAMRRRAFEHIGGFPDDDAFRRLGSMEDSVFAQRAMALFNQGRIPRRTVHWNRRPGNHQDRLAPVWEQAVRRHTEHETWLAPHLHGLRRQVIEAAVARTRALVDAPCDPEVQRWRWIRGADNRFEIQHVPDDL